MQNIQKTRFLAANYSNLQGLKSVPLGLLLILVVFWANNLRGPASDLLLPLLFSLAAALVSWAIFRYYRSRFGRVESTPRQKKLEVLLGVLGGLAGLAAFLMDTSLHLPVSLVGLVFAASALAEYFRMQWYAPGHYLLPLSLAAFAVLLVTSLLPLLGAVEWWLKLGLKAQLYGVLVIAGAVIVCYGLVGHWFLVRQLPAVEE